MIYLVGLTAAQTVADAISYGLEFKRGTWTLTDREKTFTVIHKPEDLVGAPEKSTLLFMPNGPRRQDWSEIRRLAEEAKMTIAAFTTFPLAMD